MNTAGQFFRQQLIELLMPFDQTLAGKLFGHHGQFEMGFRGRPRMPMTLVLHSHGLWLQGLLHFLFDYCLYTHRLNIPASVSGYQRPIVPYSRAGLQGVDSQPHSQRLTSDMAINWYPGHMHKANKELAKLLPNCQLVIEVLDARIPAASSNPKLDELCRGLPRLKILNKADLADPGVVSAWQESFNRLPHCYCLQSSVEHRLEKSDLLEAIARLGLEASEGRSGQIVIVGIPNVGKSTLLNHLAGRKLARTGNEPAVTKGQQRIRLDEHWYLVDTPGLLWPRLEDQQAAYRLAMTGTIRNTAIDLEDVAWFAAELLLAQYPDRLAERYGIAADCDSVESCFETIARARGALGRGGSLDWHKTAELLLNDLRSGKLGTLSLEKPDGQA